MDELDEGTAAAVESGAFLALFSEVASVEATPFSLGVSSFDSFDFLSLGWSPLSKYIRTNYQ